MVNIFRGDDTNAFDAKFISVELENSKGLEISKAKFKCGSILKTFENPVFPIRIDLTSEETLNLNYQNTCFLAIYDSEGRKRTCEGYLTFGVKNKVV